MGAVASTGGAVEGADVGLDVWRGVTAGASAGAAALAITGGAVAASVHAHPHLHDLQHRHQHPQQPIGRGPDRLAAGQSLHSVVAAAGAGRGGAMIVCWRTVVVPEGERQRFMAWITENRAVRERHGICGELVLEPAERDSDTVVVTLWPSHEVFDAWIATPERDRLTASEVHRAVEYGPISRYDVVGGYLNLNGLAEADPTPEESG